jgi:uncharacterized protein (UPF0212 family)
MSYSEIKDLMSNTIGLEEELNNLIEGISIGVVPCPNNKEEIEHELIVASRAISRVYSLALDNTEGYQDQEKEAGES